MGPFGKTTLLYAEKSATVKLLTILSYIAGFVNLPITFFASSPCLSFPRIATERKQGAQAKKQCDIAYGGEYSFQYKPARGGQLAVHGEELSRQPRGDGGGEERAKKRDYKVGAHTDAPAETKHGEDEIKALHTENYRGVAGYTH